MASLGFDPVRTHSEKLAYVNHCLRVLNARPTLNIKPKDLPKSPAPVRGRSTSFHARERKRVVAVENERLLNKLTAIDNRPSQHPTTPSRSLSRSSSNRNSASRYSYFSDRSSRASSLSKTSTVSKYSKATSKPESTASSSAHVRKSLSSSHSSTTSTSSSASSKTSDTTTSESSKSTMSRDSLERKQ
ncbi:hypothetical protein PMAYCL1PPCAC_22122, partial [Pristionchus mayeri]